MAASADGAIIELYLEKIVKRYVQLKREPGPHKPNIFDCIEKEIEFLSEFWALANEKLNDLLTQHDNNLPHIQVGAYAAGTDTDLRGIMMEKIVRRYSTLYKQEIISPAADHELSLCINKEIQFLYEFRAVDREKFLEQVSQYK